MKSPLNSALHSSLSGNLSSLPQFGGFLPSDLTGLKLWTKFNSGITVSGSGVSQWDDVSGNGNHLLQSSDTRRPSKEADGSILFDGSDNFLKADAFTLVQPETVYILFKQVTWTSGDRIFDGNTINTGVLRQATATPQLNIYAGLTVGNVSELAIGVYGVVSVVFNGASSLVSVDNNTASTGDAGSLDLSGFTLGSNAIFAQNGNIQVKEVLICSEAHDVATRAKVIAYLSNVGGL